MQMQMEPAFEQNLLCRGTTNNRQEFKLGKTNISMGRGTILQNQGETVVLPVLPSMTPLLW